MLSPEEQQLEICLLKSNLEEIGNDLVVQRSALPELDAENDRRYRETMSALRVVRSLNTEIETLKHENVRLTAKRMQLKRQCDDIAKTLEVARENRNELSNSVKQENHEIERIIRQYEDSLQERAERFRETSGYYNEEEINKEIDKVNDVIADLEGELNKKQYTVDEVKARCAAVQPEVPEGILEIIGKPELEEKVKSLTEKYKSLAEKQTTLL